VIAAYRRRISKTGLTDKPVMQSLYVNLIAQAGAVQRHSDLARGRHEELAHLHVDAVAVSCVAGNDLGIGADNLRRAALSVEFAHATGRYYDNDSGSFAQPNPAARDTGHVADVMRAIRDLAGES
jgi:hypothetical protein